MTATKKKSTLTLGHWCVDRWARTHADKINDVARRRNWTAEEVIRRLKSMAPEKIERLCGIPRGAWDVPITKLDAA